MAPTSASSASSSTPTTAIATNMAAAEPSPTAFVPPPGSTPGANRMPLLVSSIVGACFLAGCFITIRFYVRTKITKVLGMDDWLVLAAGVMLWTNGALGIWGGTLGMTHQAWEVPKENFPLMNKLALTVQTLYQTGALCVQLSIISLCLRIASAIALYKITGYVLAGVCTSLAIVRIVCNFYLVDIWYFSASIALILDVIIWCLPLPLIWSMNSTARLTTRKKLQVMATFAVGLMACGIAACRLGTRLMDTKGPAPEKRDWNRIFLLLFDQFEVSAGIVCASMPPLQPLLSIFGGWVRTHGYYPGSAGRRGRVKKRSGPEHDPQPGDSGWGSRIVKERERKQFEAALGEIHVGEGPDGHLELDVAGLGVLDGLPPPPASMQSSRKNSATHTEIMDIATSTTMTATETRSGPHPSDGPLGQISVSATPESTGASPKRQSGSSFKKVSTRLGQLFNISSPTAPSTSTSTHLSSRSSRPNRNEYSSEVELSSNGGGGGGGGSGRSGHSNDTTL
ncbi:hypothetical protein DFH27DRAFT_384809 [Peziza echinospora]|nr:hypothetical protein DFH27DRAFT_384809 [Peziza echinospora]